MRLAIGCLTPLLFLIILAGCGSAKRPFPVRGKVLFYNRPAEGAVVTFVPESGDKTSRPSAVADAEGVFRLSTRGAFDGALPGKYAVTIFYLSPETKVEGQNAGPDLLQGKYSDAATTPLHVEIKSANNELEPFALP